MKLSIKAIIGGLVVLVFVSLFSLSSSFRDLVKSEVSFNLPSLGPVENDNDSDGLDNKNEIYWSTDPENPDTDGDGFLDGEEIISGRNPIIPGPNDSFEDINLTDKLSEMAAIGMVEGSLKKDSPIKDEVLTSMNLSIIDDAVASFENRFFRIATIQVEPTQDNIKNYLSKLDRIITDFLIVYVEESKFISKEVSNGNSLDFKKDRVVNSFTSYERRTDELVKKMSDLKVPENLYDSHQSMLRAMVNISEINAALAGGLKDPIKAEIGLDRFIKYYDIVGDTVAAISKLAEKNNFDTKGTIFER